MGTDADEVKHMTVAEKHLTNISGATIMCSTWPTSVEQRKTMREIGLVWDSFNIHIFLVSKWPTSNLRWNWSLKTSSQFWSWQEQQWKAHISLKIIVWSRKLTCQSFLFLSDVSTEIFRTNVISIWIGYESRDILNKIGSILQFEGAALALMAGLPIQSNSLTRGSSFS